MNLEQWITDFLPMVPRENMAVAEGCSMPSAWPDLRLGKEELSLGCLLLGKPSHALLGLKGRSQPSP